MKAKILLPVISFFLLVASCTNSSDKKATDQSSESNVTSTDWQSRYDKIEASDLPDNVIQLIGKEWMLVTAGTKNSYNTMTASWGGIGYIWERPSTFIFIRDTRYTYQFLQREESFTLSFFDEKYRNALRICGTRSGRDTNKIEEAGLSPLETPSGLMSFGEARMIIECKKMFVQELDYANLTEPYKTKVMEESYKNESSKHQMFISEITNIWVKK
ncbi:flavin reductase family protein [Bacteroides oleiciplenus]|nr:flavin reductase [Bacteroides oleiciplenus]